MKKTDAAKRWPELSAVTQRALHKAALLDRAPLPLELVTQVDRELSSAVDAKLATIQEHDLWGESLLLDPGLRDYLEGPDVAPLPEKDLRSLIQGVAAAYTRYFVWPPPEMLQYSVDMDPHVEIAAALARRLGMDEELARMQHHRALLQGWRTQKFEKPLEYATEAAYAFRKADGGKPHPGTLALILSGLAAWQQFTKRLKEARASLLEAEKLLIPAVGKKTIEPFLIYCQLGTVCARMDDARGMKRAQDEARGIAKAMKNPALEKHLTQTLSWAQWHLQHYIGL